MSYTWEKLHLAMHSLARWGSMQERLCHAYIDHLLHINPDELPDRIKPDFAELNDDLTSGEPIGSEGTVAAFCNTLSNEEAYDYAKKIISMYDTVTRLEEPW